MKNFVKACSKACSRTARKIGEAILGWLERHIPDTESEAESRSEDSNGAYKCIAPGTPFYAWQATQLASVGHI